MTPKDVKELLKILIEEEGLPIDVVDMAPSQDLEAKYSTTRARIRDVINQWNKDGKIHVLPPGATGNHGVLYRDRCRLTRQGIARSFSD